MIKATTRAFVSAAPSHRPPGGRKFKFLRHEIFEWLVANRYEPGGDDETT